MRVGGVGAGVGVYYRYLCETLPAENAHPSYENAQIDLVWGTCGKMLRIFWGIQPAGVKKT